MAKITQGFGRTRRKNQGSPRQLDPMNPFRRLALDTRGVEQGLRGLGGMFLNAQKEDEQQAVRDNQYDDKRAIKGWTGDQQHLLTTGLDQRIFEQQKNEDGYDFMAVVDGIQSSLKELDAAALAAITTDEGRRLHKDTIEDRDKNLRPMLFTAAVTGLVARHVDSFQHEVAGLSTELNQDGIPVPRVDYGVAALLGILQPRITELSKVAEALLDAGATPMDMDMAQKAYDKSLMSALKAWSAEAHNGGRNLTYYLGLLGDNIEYKAEDGSPRTMVLSKDMSTEDAQMVAKRFLGTDPTKAEIEGLRALIPEGAPEKMGMGFQSALLNAGLPEQVVMQWLSNEVGNMHQDMKELFSGKDGIAGGVLESIAQDAGQVAGVPGTGNGDPQKLEAVASWLAKLGIGGGLYDRVVGFIAENQKGVANLGVDLQNSVGQVQGLMRGEALTEPLALKGRIITSPVLQGLLGGVTRNEIYKVATKRARAGDPDWDPDKSQPSTDDLAAAYAEVVRNYGSSNNGDLPHFLMADLLNSFGKPEDPLNAVLDAFVFDHWDSKRDSYRIRKRPSRLDRSQLENALTEGADHDDFYIKGGFGLRALIAEKDIDTATLSRLVEGEKALRAAGLTANGENGGHRTLLQLQQISARPGAKARLDSATLRLNGISEDGLQASLADMIYNFSEEQSPGTVSGADPFGPDFVSSWASDITSYVALDVWDWGEEPGWLGQPESHWRISRAESEELLVQYGPVLNEMLHAIEMAVPGAITSNEGATAARESVVMSWLHHLVRPSRFGPRDSDFFSLSNLPFNAEESDQISWGKIPGADDIEVSTLNGLLSASVFNLFDRVPKDKWDVIHQGDENLEDQVKAWGGGDRIYETKTDGSVSGRGVSTKALIASLKEHNWDPSKAVIAANKPAPSQPPPSWQEALLAEKSEALANEVMAGFGEKAPPKAPPKAPLKGATVEDLILFGDRRLFPLSAKEVVYRENIAHQMMTAIEGGKRKIVMLDDGSGGAIVGARPEGATSGWGTPTGGLFIGESALTISAERLSDTRPAGYQQLLKAGASEEDIRLIVRYITQTKDRLHKERMKKLDEGRRSVGY